MDKMLWKGEVDQKHQNKGNIMLTMQRILEIRKIQDRRYYHRSITWAVLN